MIFYTMLQTRLLIVLLFIFSFLPFLSKAQKLSAPVLLKGDTLIKVYAGWNHVTAEEKAEIILGRIAKLYELNNTIDTSKIFLKWKGDFIELFYDEQVLFSITPKDAELAEKDITVLAKGYRDAFKLQLAKNQTGSPIQNVLDVLLEVFFSVLCMAVFVGIFLLNNRFFTSLEKLVIEYQEKKLKPITYQKTEFLSVKTQTGLISSGFKFTKIFSFFLISYLFVTLFFEIFPATRGISDQLMLFISSPIVAFWNGLVSFIPHLIFIGVMLLLTHYLLQFLRFLSDNIAEGNLPIPGFEPEWARLSFLISRVLIYILLFITILPEIPFGSTVYFQVAIGVVIVLFTVMALPSLHNAMAGIALMYSPLFQEGDTILVNEFRGEVIRFTFFCTVLQTEEGRLVSVPNTVLTKNPVIIHSKTENK